jgi:hypothetical protein
MTRESSHTDESTANREPMREVSHTNPYTNESMGSLFEHGVTVVADGGERNAVEASTTTDEDDESADSMKEVSHEAPEGGHGNRMFERVGDTTDVEDEE